MKSIFTGALIGDEHTLRDWGAIITNSDVIGMPEPNTVLLEVPGRSGRLDLSEVLTGDVTYSNREIKLELAAQTNRDRWTETCFHIFNKYHGRVVHVTFDEDPVHFYVGRCSITSPKRVATAGTMVITIDAEPYRYESEVYEVTLTGATNTLSGTVENLRMPAVPKVTVPGACQLFAGGKVYELAAGEDLNVLLSRSASGGGVCNVSDLSRRGAIL